MPEIALVDRGTVEAFYLITLIILSILVGTLVVADLGCTSLKFRRSALEFVFLPGYALCASADWLQGPYVYSLYVSYGFDRMTVNVLFMVGFLSAGLLAPFAGGLADRYGRRFSCVYGYCLVYALSCLTKHVNSVGVLLVGRILGGAATSVLFSSFESWLVAEHYATGQPPEALSGSLSRMYLVNGLSGIAMGLLAQFGADAHPLQPLGSGLSSHASSQLSGSDASSQLSGSDASSRLSGSDASSRLSGSDASSRRQGSEHPPALVYAGGDVTPFDMSLGLLALGGVAIRCTWAENYAFAANAPADKKFTWAAWLADLHPSRLLTPGSPLAEARVRMSHEPLLWVFMLVSATMEASMYAFVLEWTPAVESTAGRPPLGLIFSSFMLS